MEIKASLIFRQT